MLSMIFLSTEITGAVYFCAYFSVFSELFSSKMIFARMMPMIPTNKLQTLPCKKPKEYPKIPWHRARGKVLATT